MIKVLEYLNKKNNHGLNFQLCLENIFQSHLQKMHQRGYLI